MSLLPFFEWMESLALSDFIRQSTWLGAVLNLAHVLALVMFAGAVIIVDLRLLGRGIRQQPLARVARDAQPWQITGLLGLLGTGVPQLTSTAIKQYYSPFFWLKMEVLLLAVVFTFTLRRKVALADEARLRRFWAKVVGLVSIALWAVVAVSGRLIGLL